MSIEVSTLVWRASLPAMDKLVLLRLADFADADGSHVYPSVSRVMRDCGVSERHVQNSIRRQVDAGKAFESLCPEDQARVLAEMKRLSDERQAREASSGSPREVAL